MGPQEFILRAYQLIRPCRLLLGRAVKIVPHSTDVRSVLTYTGTLVNDGATLLYRASKPDCDACELKPRCCPKMPARKVPRSIYENARDVARAIAKTETYVTSRRERKKIEMLFAHLMRLYRLWLRGPSGAQFEFLLAATVQNLRKLAKLIPLPVPMPAREQTHSRALDSLQHPKQLGHRLLQHNPPEAVVEWLSLCVHAHSAEADGSVVNWSGARRPS
jgi:hypothetical protein